MPVYEYRCENGHEFEVLQRMGDPSAEECTTCGARVQRIFRPPAIHFKGSGFYNTDYGRRKRGGESADGAGAGSSDGGGGESKTEKGGDQKGNKKEGSSSGSGSGSSGSSDSKKSETAA